MIGLVVFSFLIFLFPLALYCLVLALVNASRRPILLPGSWDVVGLLFGLSGFLLATVPMLLSMVLNRILVMYQSTHVATATLSFWLGYYLLIVCGAALILGSRRRTTVIYNVNTERFAERLEAAIHGLGLDYVVLSTKFVIAPAEAFTTATVPNDLAEAITADPVGTPLAVAPPLKIFNAMPGDPRYCELTVDLFPMLCHITLHWENDSSALRHEIENRLAHTLDDAVAVENPSSVWFLGFSGLVFGGITMIVAFLVLFPTR